MNPVGSPFALCCLADPASQLYRIPAVGYSAPILSYWGAIQFFLNAREMLQEGYSKVCYVDAIQLGDVLRRLLT